MDYDADTSLTDTGVWREFGDAKFLIAHISNLKFQRALSRHQQPHRRSIENGTIDPKVNRDILCKAMAEGVLLDWSGVTSKDTKEPVPYESAKGLRMLQGNVEFRDFISEVASSIANYRQEAVDELGNS